MGPVYATRLYIQSCCFESALSAAAALLALGQAARSVKNLTHDRSGFFNELNHLFTSLVVLRHEREQYKRKQAIKFIEDNGLIAGQLFDPPRCLPQCQQSRCRGQDTLETT
ncbi:hypothetical protein Y032_0062g3375 [Ancylostoma ceylanicum]|uniref:Uncharacterized protein n=1 Tax=Ancylostoma ceylanicum TaxID=53326 RepID=A0A016U1Z2_9BILA|nr:hypothetical protein Y032_0062g3375 [Ancylostoma ceylanicum]